ncbi:uncharacterized protein LOC142979881 [Anticarsia gemmatalis]|uniref:uncharacterized protein LOC142979881 n=1 Tax=Anticarsia gemmatalis TaxID=129554 RepID=UPI003F7727FF
MEELEPFIVCAVYTCNVKLSHNKFCSKEPDIRASFHRFPDDDRREAWLKACGREDLSNLNPNLLSRMFICDEHFEKQMYEQKILKADAIPTLNLKGLENRSVSSQTTRKVFISQEVQTGGSTTIERRIEPEVLHRTNLAQDTVSDALKLPDERLKKRIRTDPFERVIKARRVMSNEDKRFLLECDKRLPPKLSEVVKLYVKMKHMS